MFFQTKRIAIDLIKRKKRKEFQLLIGKGIINVNFMELLCAVVYKLVVLNNQKTNDLFDIH